MTHEDRIAEILGAWQDQRDRGHFVDPDSLCAEHPDLADELRMRLAALNIVEQAYAESRMFEGETPKRLGEYEIVRELGRGGMGVVYEAIQTSMRRTVALKVLFPSVTGSRRAVERFQREARAAGRVQHTNIVPVYSLSREEGTWYYAMELVQGSSLAMILRHLRDLSDVPGEEHRTLLHTDEVHAEESADDADPEAPDVPSPTASQFTETHGSSRYYRDVAHLFADVADALQAAHDEGVIHRDLKPSNLILDEKGVLKIVDFGIARIGTEASGMTVTGELLGTPIYMSPEQARAKANAVDHRTDIYSLGASLYEVLTLRTPFKGTTFPEVYRQILTTQPVAPRHHSAAIPRDLETIVLKAMEKAPSQRYAAAGDFARDLRDFASGGAIRARRIGPFGRSWRMVKRHKVRSALVASTLIALSVAAYLGVQSGREEERLRNMEYESLLTGAHGAMSRQGLLRDDSFRVLHRRTEQAYERLERAIALAPNRYEAWFARAMAASRTVEERLEDIEEAHRRGLSSRTMHLARAAVFEGSARHIEAKAERGRAAKFQTNTRAGHFFEGMMLVRRGEHEKGVPHLTSVIEAVDAEGLLPNLARYWRARARERQGDLAGALEDLLALPIESRISYASLIRVAALWKRLGQTDRAQEVFERALASAKSGQEDLLPLFWACQAQRVRPWIAAVAKAAADQTEQTPETLLIQAESAAAANDPELSLRLAGRVVEMDEGNPRGHLFRAQALMFLGRRKDAMQAVDLAVEHSAEDSRLLGAAGACLLNLGHPTRALKVFERAIANDPHQDPTLLSGRGLALAFLHRFKEAESAHEAARRLDPNDPMIWMHRGNALHAQGEAARGKDPVAYRAAFEEAVTCFTAATKRSPGDGRPWSSLAAALNNLGRFDEALSASEKAILLKNDGGHGRFTKAFALSGLRRDADALAILDRMLAEGDQRARVHLLHARILVRPAYARYKQRDFAGSTEEFERALRFDAVRKDLNSGHLYNAACSAALASADAEEAEAARFRERALAWLREDRRLRRERIAQLRKQDPAPPNFAAIEEQFRQLREHARSKDPDLATLRGLKEFRELFGELQEQASEPAGVDR